jgi:predicted ribosome-associated RNA-binding protein Tma20
VVVDIKYRKPLALGESINDFDIVKSAKKGPVAKNVHFVSDKIWDLSKLLSV